MERLTGIKAGLDQLSQMVVMVSQATTDLERTEHILEIQYEIQRLYGLVKSLEERPLNPGPRTT